MNIRFFSLLIDPIRIFQSMQQQQFTSKYKKKRLSRLTYSASRFLFSYRLFEQWTEERKRLTEKRGYGRGSDSLLIFRLDRRRLCSFLFRCNRGQFLGICEHTVARRFLTRWHRQLSNDHALVGQPPRIRDQKRGLLLLIRARRSLLRPRIILRRGLSRFVLVPSTHLLDPDRSLLQRTTLFRGRILPDVLGADLLEKGEGRY